jgi:hypothetical protein
MFEVTEKAGAKIKGLLDSRLKMHSIRLLLLEAS